MKSHNRDTRIFILVLLCVWLTFLFSEAVLSKQKVNDEIIKEVEFQTQIIQQELYKQIEEKVEKEQFSGVKFNTIQEQTITTETKNYIKNELQLSSSDITNMELENITKNNGSTSTLEDIEILEKLHKDSNNDAIVQVLIQKLAQDYQFDKAYQYANKLITKDGLQSIDATLYLTIWMNSSQLSVMQPQSIEKLKPIVDSYRTRGLLTTDDYRFYQAMIALWYEDYDGSLILLKQLTSPRYQGLYDSIIGIHQQVAQQQDMPAYYESALISLQLLKKGYFIHAKKLALNVLTKDDNYILPYQVLAYSAFLTNSREDAIDYFLKLAELDKQKSDRYKFFVGVSYFWLDNTENSVLYLSQIETSILEKKNQGLSQLLTDTYRYLLLNYRKANDQTYMINTRQKILGQHDLGKSDFYLYFYETLFKPLTLAESYTMYHKNPMIANEHVEKCYNALPKKEQDICLYGHAGFDFLNYNSDKAEKKLLYIAKYYPQSYIFHTLGDLYRRGNDLEKAKTYYIKAVSMTQESGEEMILQGKISEVMDGR